MDILGAKSVIFDALDFLERECSGGFFKVGISSEISMKRTIVAEEEFFSSIVILGAISNLKLEKAQRLKNLISEMLVSEIKKNDGKIYFFKNSAILPPDLDDSCLAIIDLLEMGKISWQEVQNFIGITKKNKRGSDGFWVYFKEEAKKACKANRVEMGVNVNVARFLRLAGAPDLELEGQIFKFLKSGGRKLRYYFYPTFLYMFGKLLINIPNEEEILQIFLEAVSQEIKKLFNYPYNDFSFLYLACLLSTLARFGVDTNDFYVELLLSLFFIPFNERSWAFCRAGSKRNFYGSPAISTAIAVEALGLIYDL